MIPGLGRMVVMKRESTFGNRGQSLVEFAIDRCLITLTEARDGLPAGHTVWSA